MSRIDALLRLFKKPIGNKDEEKNGFSIVEIIIVIALIGTLLSIMISSLTSTQDEAMKDAARLGMGKIQQSLQLYRVHNHRFPTNEQGLKSLVTNVDGSSKWRGPYLEEEKIKDPWGKEYEYESDGRNIKMISAGPDGEFGTEDDVKYPEEAEGAEGGERQ